MGYWLAEARRGQDVDAINRFDPRFWTVNFPRPMMAAVTAEAHDSLRLTCAFYRRDDLAGLIWASEDADDHPLLRYATDRDYRRCVLSFRWRSSGVRALDAVNGPVLTIEGRDAAGAPRAWYVRLWNYAEGTPEDARVRLDFGDLSGGFLLPDEADPVWAGDVDRMFVSLVPPDYDGSDAMLAEPGEGWAELSEIGCDGSGSVIAIGDAIVPEHGLGIANGYDDSYHLTPARVLRNILHLGYRGDIVHYVGMSHYFRLEGNSGGLYVSLKGGTLNAPCAAWHRDFAACAKALGFGVIWSLSYELFDAHCWNDWKQRASDGSPALTGWEPPSTLLSPAHDGAMGYLRSVAAAFVGIAAEAGLAVQFQIGEPWWWVMPDGRPCLYDAAAKDAFGGAPLVLESVRGALSEEARALLDKAGAVLAQSTLTLRDAVRVAAPGAVVLLLAYLPTVLDAQAPEVQRMNLPVGWARPAFDILQLEDYDWAQAGNEAASARAIARVAARLGYPVDEQHYFAGFVLRPEDRGQWDAIHAAALRGQARGVAATFVWALPQVMRDGFIHFDEEAAVQAFDDVLFPIALGSEAEVTTEVSTAIVTSAGGYEKRNADWAAARGRYDVGPGVRSEADIALLIDFYRARMGPARGFRLRDPFDHRSGPEGAATDQRIGTGDGESVRFALVKRHGESERRITRPVAGSIRVAVAGVETANFTLAEGGWVELDEAPAHGAAVTAGFSFDVPVRFAEDRLDVSGVSFAAGEAPSVALIEIREAA